MTDPNFRNTTLLLQADNAANSAQNNTFLDSSANSFSITRNGNTTQGTFTPFSQGWSNFFGGSGNYLESSHPTASSTWTIEAWVYRTSGSAEQCIVFLNGGSFNGILFYIDSSNYLKANDGGTILPAYTNVTVPINAWTHVAIVRSGSTVTGYVNGVVAGSNSFTAGATITTARIGYYVTANAMQFPGYISNVRVVNGTAVYTSTFTPPTTPLTAITNTSLLTCQSNRFVDNSSNAYAITPTGTPSVQPFAPFAPQFQYTQSVIGGSGFFDGTGDYLSTPDNNAFDLGTGDFTFECWLYKPNNNDATMIGGSATGDWEFAYVSGSLRFGRFNVVWDTTQLYTIPSNAWTHIALTRVSGRLYFFANGTLLNAGGTANTGSYNMAATVFFGVAGDTTSRILTGNMAGVRLIKSQGLATASFTPPTAPVTATTVGWTGAASSITGTVSVLLNFSNAGIIDGTMDNVLETLGNAQVSTSVVKYGSGSLAFDGTGDYLRLPTSPNLGVGTGDFTIEFWIYRSANGNQIIFDQRSTATQVALCIFNDGNDIIRFFVNGSNVITGGTIPLATWTHFALCKANSLTRMFFNGAQVGSTYVDTNNYVTNPLFIGAQFDTASGVNGYLDDLRITKGVARYLSNFTPPQVALPRQ